MRTMSLVLLAAATALSVAPASARKAPGAAHQATATLLAPDGSPRGTVRAVDTGKGVKITISATGLPPGEHGAHVHAVGDCTPPDFKSAGGHWNPQGHEHGRDNPKGMHMGDLPNLTVGANGKGMLVATVEGASLAGGDAPMLDADGAALVIHAGPDDMKTDPSGNSGGRIACGVLKAR